MYLTIILTLALVVLLVLPHSTLNSIIARRKVKRSFKTRFDEKIPFRPNWAWVYFTAYPLNIGGLVYFVLKLPEQIVWKTLTAYIALCLIAIFVWFFYPVKVERKEILPEAGGLSIKLIRKFQRKFPPYCSHPSLHVSFSLTTGFFFSYHFGLAGMLMAVIAMLISLATLYTKQHCLLDVVCGGFLSGMIIMFFTHALV